MDILKAWEVCRFCLFRIILILETSLPDFVLKVVFRDNVGISGETSFLKVTFHLDGPKGRRRILPFHVFIQFPLICYHNIMYG